MNKTIGIAALGVLLIALLAYFQLNQSPELVVEEDANQAGTGSSSESLGGVPDIYITEVEIPKTENDFGVYVTTSAGEKRKIAESDNLETIENYFEITTYHESFISPDKKFVTLEGSVFEDGFIAVYDVQADTLHEQESGYVNGWTEDGLLEVDACDLSGTQCTYLISRDAATPWELIVRGE